MQCAFKTLKHNVITMQSKPVPFSQPPEINIINVWKSKYLYMYFLGTWPFLTNHAHSSLIVRRIISGVTCV